MNRELYLYREYMTKYPKLTKGKFSSSFTLKDSIHLWNEISDILNSVNGAKKDWKGWRKVRKYTRETCLFHNTISNRYG